MFKGEYNHTIDAKGRLIIPSKFRGELGEKFTLTRGADGCLYVYPEAAWEQFEEKLMNMPLMSREARAATHFFVSGAQDCELDKQGRILVPATLRKYASLDKDVVLAGNLDHVEIWSQDNWHKITGAFDDEYAMDNIAKGLQDIGVRF